MPSLIIMRHAKAIDRTEEGDDFERGLAERGHEDADRAAGAMKAAGLSASHALVSPARRTAQTFDHVKSVLGEPPAESPMALYHASESMLERAVLEALAKGHQRLVLVGHNPGVGAFAHALADRADARDGLPWGWPTSAAIACELEGADLSAPSRTFFFNPKA
jgi:phosphohistidine phosphatase